MSKTILSIFLLVAALVCLLVPQADADSARMPEPEDNTVDLFISPDDTFVVKGHTFQLRVHIDTDSADFMGYDITVHFDNLRLQIVSVDEGTFPLDSGYPTFFRWLNEGTVVDHIQVNGAILGHSVRGHGVLFTLTFKAVALNNANVSISSSELRDGENVSLPHTTDGAIVRIITSIDAETPTWGAIKNRYQ